MKDLALTQIPCLQGAGRSGSCAGLDGPNGFTESWLGHNCIQVGMYKETEACHLERGKRGRCPHRLIK